MPNFIAGVLIVLLVAVVVSFIGATISSVKLLKEVDKMTIEADDKLFSIVDFTSKNLDTWKDIHGVEYYIKPMPDGETTVVEVEKGTVRYAMAINWHVWKECTDSEKWDILNRLLREVNEKTK